MLIGLAVRLVIPDTTAVSARQALRQAGLHDLLDLRREECWGFAVDDGNTPQIIAERLLATDILVNYNKHRGRWWEGPLAAAAPGDESPTQHWGRLLVEDRDDPQPAHMQQMLTARLGYTGIRVLRRATLWSVGVAAGADVARVTQRAADLLLVNTHGQLAQLVSAGSGQYGGMPARQ